MQPYRYETSELESYVTFAVREARRIRPDLFLGTFKDAIADLVSGSAFPMPDEYAPVVAHYVAGRAELRDDEFAADGRAVTLLKLYHEQLMGV